MFYQAYLDSIDDVFFLPNKKMWEADFETKSEKDCRNSGTENSCSEFHGGFIRIYTYLYGPFNPYKGQRTERVKRQKYGRGSERHK
jgi:hypothetical protein